LLQLAGPKRRRKPCRGWRRGAEPAAPEPVEPAHFDEAIRQVVAAARLESESPENSGGSVRPSPRRAGFEESAPRSDYDQILINVF